MSETIAILLLASAFYLVLRRLPKSLEIQGMERQQEKVAQKEVRAQQVEAILAAVVPPLPVSSSAPAEGASSAEETDTTPEPLITPQYSEEVATLLTEADAAFDRQSFDEAEKKYITICAIEPRISHVYNRLGAIYLKKENLEDAKEALEAGLKIEPFNAQILNNLGLVYFTQSKFTDSIRYYERSIRSERGVAARYVNLGLSYMALRQYSKAIHQFKRASNLEPDNEEFKKLVIEAQTKYAESRVGMVTR